MMSRATNTYNDGLQNGGRRPHLLVAYGAGHVVEFQGQSIPGVLAVTHEESVRNGKWSNTTYQFQLAGNASAVRCLHDLHQTPLAQWGSWTDVTNAFSTAADHAVNEDELQVVLRSCYPKSSEALVAREAALRSLATPKASAARWLLNAFSLNMVELPATARFEEVDLETARQLADGAESAVGHADTAAVFASLLGLPVVAQRSTVSLQPGDEALVGQYRGPRLPEGATSLPEGATVVWVKVKVRVS